MTLPPIPDHLHGTTAGYDRHRRRKEPTCQPCRDANAAKGRQRRRDQGIPPRQLAQCGTNAGKQAHYRKQEPPCQPCVEAARTYHREYQRQYRAAKRAAAQANNKGEQQ